MFMYLLPAYFAQGELTTGFDSGGLGFTLQRLGWISLRVED